MNPRGNGFREREQDEYPESMAAKVPAFQEI
jgi:hypothetical protein